MPFFRAQSTKAYDRRKRAKILADNRKSQHPIETLKKRLTTSLLLRRFDFQMAEVGAKREWLVMNRKRPWEGVSFPPSFARTFLSKERRLGTRQPQDSGMGLGTSLYLKPEVDSKSRRKIPRNRFMIE